MNPWRIAVVIELETDDRRLHPDRINYAPRTVEETKITRQAVIDNLLRTDRVILVTGPEIMRAILETTELAMSIVGMPVAFTRPPEGDHE